MRILVGFTPGGVHPDTAAAIDEFVPPPLTVDTVDVSGDDFAYWRAISQRWDGTQDLVIVEQDNVIHESVIPQFAACAGDWCVFPYEIFNSAQRLTQGLGCTKFSAALQRRVPAAEFETDGKLYAGDADGVPWNFLDLVIAERLKLGHGLIPHIHEPDVQHRHDYTAMPELGVDGENSRRDDTNPYHRQLPIVFDPTILQPAVHVYGAAISDVSSLEDAARLANALRERYMNDDGTTRDTPAQLDTSAPPPLRFKTDKVQQGYLPTYLRIAAEIGLSGRVCEIGVWRGESLQMWQALFPGGCVCGVDRNPTMMWPRETVRVVAEQNDPELPADLAAISPDGWDIIVDDASHDGKLTRTTWELLWPLVRPGGWYVIEDWHVGFGDHPLFPGDQSMLRTAESFLTLLGRPGSGRLLPGQVESAEYRYGMIVLRKTAVT